ncbi:ABC transporter permease [Roseovarius aquimarinus]|uniref:ABC transporter permease n=1 Tax=Roseovarius aquimarinus TaxID=1229156 RepID=A0ABW7I4B0_9RHOB
MLDLLRTVAARPSGAIGLALTAFHLGIAILAPLFAPFDPTAQNADAILLAPSTTHWMGNDALGRDVFSRVLYGGRLALVITFCGAVLATLLGGFLGIFFGTVGGRIDEVAMRIVDAFLSMPWLLFLLLIISIGGAGPVTIIPTLGFFYGMAVLRVVRGAAMQVAARDFITAAKARGEALWPILTREMFPNLADILLVEGAMRWSWMLLAFSSLSFLGFGATPPTPDWGLMVAQERGLLATAPWAVFWPCAALSSLIIGINLLADAVGKALGLDRASAMAV